MLYSQGIPLESLESPGPMAARWRVIRGRSLAVFAENYYLFNGTPTGAWLDYEFMWFLE
jgi:glucuronate isomerase